MGMVAILVNGPRPFQQSFVPPTYSLNSLNDLALQ